MKQVRTRKDLAFTLYSLEPAVVILLTLPFPWPCPAPLQLA